LTEQQVNIIESLKADVAKAEDKKRYAHTLGVVGECDFYADVVGLDGDSRFALECAALLHDVTKNLPRDEAIALCRRHGIRYSDSPTLHQDTCAPYIKEHYGKVREICSDTVLSAVSKHTTGGADMSATDMILYIADFTEPGRKYENCVRAREYIRKECENINKNDKNACIEMLERAVMTICKMTIEHLSGKHSYIDRRTGETLLNMQRRLGE